MSSVPTAWTCVSPPGRRRTSSGPATRRMHVGDEHAGDIEVARRSGSFADSPCSWAPSDCMIGLRRLRTYRLLPRTANGGRGLCTSAPSPRTTRNTMRLSPTAKSAEPIVAATSVPGLRRESVLHPDGESAPAAGVTEEAGSPLRVSGRPVAAVRRRRSNITTAAIERAIRIARIILPTKLGVISHTTHAWRPWAPRGYRLGAKTLMGDLIQCRRWFSRPPPRHARSRRRAQ